MLAFLNHKTGKLIYTENKNEIPRVGLAITGWEKIHQETYRDIINLDYSPPAWDYPSIKLYAKARNNPENSHLMRRNK